MWLIRTKTGSDLLQMLEGNWWPQAIGVLCLVVLIWLVVRLVARANEDADPAEVDREMLMTMVELHREGDLTQDEYRSIKGQLVRRMQPPQNEVSAGAGQQKPPAATAAGDQSERPANPAQAVPSDRIAETENIDEAHADNHGRTNPHPRSEDQADGLSTLP